MNETLVRSDGRNVLRVERRFPHPPAKVWRAVSEPAELSAWFPSAVELDELRAGGAIRFVGDGFEQAGTIREVDPPRLLAFDWDGELLRFELSADGSDGTLLVFTHAFDDRAGAASFAAGWNGCFDALDARLAGAAPPPPADAVAMGPAHERFLARFGLDEGEVERLGEGDSDGEDGWRISFERQLTRTAAEVWPLLTAAASVRGTPTTVDEPRLVECEDDGGALRVRWRLGDGTGQGARLFVTVTARGASAGEPAPALAAWRARIARLAADVTQLAPA